MGFEGELMRERERANSVVLGPLGSRIRHSEKLRKLSGLVFLSRCVRVRHKREICYLGSGDVTQLSTKINHIEKYYNLVKP